MTSKHWPDKNNFSLFYHLQKKHYTKNRRYKLTKYEIKIDFPRV